MNKISQKDIEYGKIVLGGCLVGENDPDWHCNESGNEWIQKSGDGQGDIWWLNKRILAINPKYDEAPNDWYTYS